MNIYCVYSDSKKNQVELLIVKQGFSIYAALFNFFWALYHRMWLIVFITVALSILAFPLEKLRLYYIFDISLLFIFGFFASDFKDYYAYKKGYVLSDIVTAHDDEEAELKYYYKQSMKTINHV